MKEAIIHPGTTVSIRDSPMPVPRSNEVVTKVIVSGSNPKDWYVAALVYKLLACSHTRSLRKGPEWTNQSLNQGDDIAGIVHAVGDNVVEFQPGDRVAALHQLRAPGGSYAEYAVSPAYTTFHLPKRTSFEGKAWLSLSE